MGRRTVDILKKGKQKDDKPSHSLLVFSNSGMRVELSRAQRLAVLGVRTLDVWPQKFSV